MVGDNHMQFSKQEGSHMKKDFESGRGQIFFPFIAHYFQEIEIRPKFMQFSKLEGSHMKKEFEGRGQNFFLSLFCTLFLRN